MVLCSAKNITKNYSEKILLEDVTLHISKGDKIGVVGINGTGKSTFLKIIAGIETSESGSITTFDNAKISYLPQNPIYEQGTTIIEQVFKGASKAFKDLKIYEAKTILTKLGIEDFDRDVSLLSGGEKKRVAIASVLINPSDILVLDEPTNHIDNTTVVWLETHLSKFAGAILMVTHDRYFLDRVTNKIIEIDQGSLYAYDANYSEFLDLKSQREEMEQNSNRKRNSMLRRELEWIKQGPKARGRKSKIRIEKFEELKEQQQNVTSQQKLDVSSVSSRLGGKIVHINNVSKSFEDKKLIDDFSYNLLRDDRIGIIGTNGCGKSTLLKMITGSIVPDVGDIDIGSTVKIGYYSQEFDEMDINLRVIDYIKEIAENIETPDGIVTASKMLEKFLFPANQQWNTIGKLSGGERKRLFLLRTIMEAPNILLLDEPTNDLDIITLMILEDYLKNFKGAVVVVSHDRYFLDKVVDKVFAFQDNGIIKEYLGGYSDYLKQIEKIDSSNCNQANKDKTVKKPKAQSKKQSKPKFTFNEQREFNEIDNVISDLEDQLENINKEIENAISDYVLLEKLSSEKLEIESQLEEKMERWMYLNELNDQILESKKSD